MMSKMKKIEELFKKHKDENFDTEEEIIKTFTKIYYEGLEAEVISYDVLEDIIYQLKFISKEASKGASIALKKYHQKVIDDIDLKDLFKQNQS
jgi:hypothetical protein